MATLSPQNRGYSSGSLAAQPTRHAGGVRGRNEDPAQFRARMDGGAMAHGQMPRGVTPPPMAAPTRQDNIIASRVDGTFNTKRNAFNAANAGKLTMDEAGNINPAATPATPAAPPTPSPTPTPTASPVPPVNQVTPPTPKLPAGGSSPMMKPIGKIDGRPASLVLGEMKQQPGAAPSPAVAGVRPPVTRTAGGELVQPGNAMNPNARYGKPAAAPAAPMMAQAPAPAAPAMAPAAPAPATSITTADKVWAKTQKTMRPTPMSGPGAPTLEGRAQALQDAARLSQATQGPMPRPMGVQPPAAKPLPPIQLANANPMAAGSQQFQQEFKNFRTGLTMKPAAPAVIPNPKSTAPQPFSAAALGTNKPRAVMPPSLVALNR